MLFISEAMAQANNAGVPQQPSAMGNLIPLILIFLIFYMFIIRPKQKEFKQHNEMLDSIRKNDEVVTSGGVVGKVKKVEDNILEVEIATDVVVKIMRTTITRNNSAQQRVEKEAAKQEKK